MSFDTHCYELAEYFAEDEGVTEKQTADLAQTIQTCIEDWLSNLESDREAARQNAADHCGNGCPWCEARAVLAKATGGAE
jgi:hypothetical protein